jgi:hypothetical protein
MARTRTARQQARRWAGPFCAALLIAALPITVPACGQGVTHPGATSPAPGATATRAGVTEAQPRPIPAATLRAMVAGGSWDVTPVMSPQGAVADLARSETAAMRTALAQQPRGSKVLGMTLARIRGPGPGFHQSRLTWLVSVDPYGGAFSVNGPACGMDNFVVEFVDPVNGTWLMAMTGAAPGLRPLPALGPKPTVAPGTRCLPVPGPRSSAAAGPGAASGT